MAATATRPDEQHRRRGDPGQRHAEPDRQSARRRQADAHAGEAARADRDGKQRHGAPVYSRRVKRRLDGRQQPGGLIAAFFPDRRQALAGAEHGHAQPGHRAVDGQDRRHGRRAPASPAQASRPARSAVEGRRRGGIFLVAAAARKAPRLRRQWRCKQRPPGDFARYDGVLVMRDSPAWAWRIPGLMEPQSAPSGAHRDRVPPIEKARPPGGCCGRHTPPGWNSRKECALGILGS